MAALRRIVLDVMKPHDPELLPFVERIAEVDGIEGVSGSLIELDTEVQNVKLTVEGESLNYEAIEAAIQDLGGTVHSVDQISMGDHLVEDRWTLQDG